MKDNVFSIVGKFRIDGDTFVRLNSIKYGDAFVKIVDDKYVLPSMVDLYKISSIFYSDKKKNIFEIKFNINKTQKVRYEPKVVHKGKVLVISSAIALAVLQGCNYSEKDIPLYTFDTSQQYVYNSYSELDYEANAQRAYDITSEGDTYIYINNNEKFDEIFGKKETTIEDINNVVDNNKGIPDEYKGFVKQYFLDLKTYYPDLDLRVYEYNLKTLKFDIKDNMSIQLDAASATTYAYWDNESNTIVLPDTTDLDNNYFDLIAMRHELAHLGNHFYIKDGGYTFKYNFDTISTGEYVLEGLNCLFSTQPFINDYYENGVYNIGYPVITNELRIIVEAIDYPLERSIDHNIYYLEYMIDNYTDGEVDAHNLLNLIDMQEIDVESANFELDDESYRELYSSIFAIYMKKHYTDDMGYDDIQVLREDFKTRLLIGIKDSSRIKTDIIDSIFDDFCESNNINNSIEMR